MVLVHPDPIRFYRSPPDPRLVSLHQAAFFFTKWDNSETNHRDTDHPTHSFIMAGSLRGSPENPGGGFDEVGEALANNGRCFVKKVFRLEDLQAYMFRLFLEYARLMAPTDQGVDFVYDPEIHGVVDDGGEAYDGRGRDRLQDQGAEGEDEMPDDASIWREKGLSGI